MSQSTDDIAAEVNRVRATHGLPALVVDARLAAESQTWADHMALTGRFAHGGGEEIIAAADWEQTAQEVVQSWMDSRGHRAWILSSSNRCGFGKSHARGGWGWYWSGSFNGSPLGSEPPTSGPAPPVKINRPWWSFLGSFFGKR